jgi:hypothetical protein
MELQTREFRAIYNDLLRGNKDIKRKDVVKAYVDLWDFTEGIIENRNILAEQWKNVDANTRLEINQRITKEALE